MLYQRKKPKHYSQFDDVEENFKPCVDYKFYFSMNTYQTYQCKQDFLPDHSTVWNKTKHSVRQACLKSNSVGAPTSANLQYLL